MNPNSRNFNRFAFTDLGSISVTFDRCAIDGKHSISVLSAFTQSAMAINRNFAEARPTGCFNAQAIAGKLILRPHFLRVQARFAGPIAAGSQSFRGV